MQIKKGNYASIIAFSENVTDKREITMKSHKT
jgi:hypothetical protein